MGIIKKALDNKDDGADKIKDILDYQITTITFNIYYKKTDRDYKRLLFLNYIDIAGERLKEKIENNNDKKILEEFEKYKLYIQNCIFDKENTGKHYYCPDNFRNFSN